MREAVSEYCRRLRDASPRALLVGAVAMLVLAGVGAAVVPLFQAGSGVAYETSSGLYVKSATDHGVGSGNPFTGTDTVAVGNVTFTASGDANVTVDRFTGTWTNLSDVDADPNAVTVNPDDKQSVTISSDATAVSFRDATVDDGTVDVVYSAGSSVSHGLPANTDVTAATPGGTDLGTATSDGSGTVTLSLPSGSSTQVLLFENDAPVIDESTLDPAEGETPTTTPIEFSVAVSDGTFGTVQGDELNATLFIDGAARNYTLLSSNGTANVTVSALTSGSHEYYWRVEDSYGATAQSSTTNFSVPDQLEIRNESDPDSLVTSAEVEIRFYYREDDPAGEPAEIVTRSTTTGTVDFTGLDATRPFVVVADADGYIPRRIYVESLTETQEVYLLPESKQSVKQEMVLTDYTGLYDSDDSVLLIQRALNGSWRTVQGDFFGATGSFPAQLRYNVRHRLVLINTETDRRRVLGTITPLADGAQDITVKTNGDITVEQATALAKVSPATRSLVAADDPPLEVRLQGQNADVDSWDVTVSYNDTSGSVTTLTTLSKTGTETLAEPNINLTGRAGGEVIVETTITFGDGTTSTTSATYRVRERYQNGVSLLAALGGVTDGLPSRNVDMFTTLVSVVTTVLGTAAMARATRVSTEAVGLAAVTMLAAWSVVGWIAYSIVFATGVGWGALVFLRRAA